MQPPYNSPQPPYRSTPAAPRPRMDGTTRLLIVGGIVAVLSYIAAPYVLDELVSVGRQLGRMGNHTGFDPPFDPFGVRPKAEASDRDPGRIPPGLGNAAGDDPGKDVTRRHQQWQPGDDPAQRPWRLCQDSADGRRKRCTEWRTGPVPEQWRGQR